MSFFYFFYESNHFSCLVEIIFPERQTKPDRCPFHELRIVIISNFHKAQSVKRCEEALVASVQRVATSHLTSGASSNAGLANNFGR